MFHFIVLLFYLVIGIIGVVWDPSFLLTFSCWIFILQGFYFLSHYLFDNMFKKILLNMIFAPSVYVVMYWFFPSNTPFVLNICAHGLNVLLMIYVVYKYPVIGQFDNVLNIILPIIPCAVYLTFAIIYTYTTMSLIYPTNFFGFIEIEGKPPYALQAIILNSYGVAIIHTLSWYICSSIKY